MKPQAVDKEMWNEIYDVYVKDKFNLGVQDYFENAEPCRFGRNDCGNDGNYP